MLEYIRESFDSTIDTGSLAQVLTKAKVALGGSDVPSHMSKKKKNTETRARYSMSVAEQLVTTVERSLRDDRSQPNASAK